MNDDRSGAFSFERGFLACLELTLERLDNDLRAAQALWELWDAQDAQWHLTQEGMDAQVWMMRLNRLVQALEEFLGKPGGGGLRG